MPFFLLFAVITLANNGKYILGSSFTTKSSLTSRFLFTLVQNAAEDSCKYQPTLVSKPFKRTDLFNGQLTDVLLTSLLVTTIGNMTVAHIGTENGRLLQVAAPTEGFWGRLYERALNPVHVYQSQ